MKKIYNKPVVVVESAQLYAFMASESNDQSVKTPTGTLHVYSKEASWDDEENDEY